MVPTALHSWAGAKEGQKTPTGAEIFWRTSLILTCEINKNKPGKKPLKNLVLQNPKNYFKSQWRESSEGIFWGKLRRRREECTCSRYSASKICYVSFWTSIFVLRAPQVPSNGKREKIPGLPIKEFWVVFRRGFEAQNVSRSKTSPKNLSKKRTHQKKFGGTSFLEEIYRFVFWRGFVLPRFFFEVYFVNFACKLPLDYSSFSGLRIMCLSLKNDTCLNKNGLKKLFSIASPYCISWIPSQKWRFLNATIFLTIFSTLFDHI